MNIKLWKNFNKRKNSTKQPVEAEATILDVKLKENCSVESPSFILSNSDFDYNYAYAFGHYYYIDNITMLTNQNMQIDCSQDLLATHKSAITGSTFKVLYDETTNTELVDNRIAVKSTPSVSVNTAALRTDVSAAGSFIVALNGTNTVGTYVIPQGNLSRLMPDIGTIWDTFIGSENPYVAITNAFKQLVSSGSISQNIRDVRWMPFSVTGDTLITPLKVGNYEVLSESGIALGARRIDTRIQVETSTINIPWQFNDWRNTSPYTEVYLYIPFIGLVSYPASNLKGTTALTVKTSLNVQSGDIAIEVKAGERIIGTYGASTGVSVALGSSNLSPTGLVNSIMAGVGAVAAGQVLTLASASINAIQPLNVSVGGISSGAGSGLDLSMICFTVCHDTIEAPDASISVMGTPAMVTKSLSNLTGYVQTQDASIAIGSLGPDKDEINSLLNSGIFIE